MNFIWDLDGTLLDSYNVINTALAQTLDDLGIQKDLAAAREYIIKYSVSRYFEELAPETGLTPRELKRRFDVRHVALTDEISLIPGARETLETLSRMGHRHFVATHRGESAYRALDHLGIRGYFTDILTSRDGFKRKPDPESVNFLIDRHALSRPETFYVGDRSLDVECGKNAGIGTIFYKPEGSPALDTGRQDYTVKDLREILSLFGEAEK